MARLRILLAALTALPLVGARTAAPPAPADAQARCAALAAQAPRDVRITRAAVEPAGTGWAGGEAAPGRRPPTAVKAGFCRVQGIIETEIGFELWLPLQGAWNGKFLGAGVGADAGTFN